MSKKSKRSKVYIAITNVVKMKATKNILFLLALNKPRKRKILFHRKMKTLLLTFALFSRNKTIIIVLIFFLDVSPFTAVLILIQIRVTKMFLVN